METLAFFTEIAIVSGIAVTILQQILKLKIVPITIANRYPVPTNIVLSFVASAVALYVNGSLAYASLLEIAVTGVTTAVVAAMTYNHLLANWKQLQKLEG